MKIGLLDFFEALDSPDLLAQPVIEALQKQALDGVYSTAIDSGFADTAAFCEHYDIGLDISANCVVIEAKRADRTWYAACMILATEKADVNGVIRRHLDARKTSFAPMDKATSLTRMEYGGITPIGLPSDWPILVDSNVAESDFVVIGSGLRSSKLAVRGSLLVGLPGASVLNLAKVYE